MAVTTIPFVQDLQYRGNLTSSDNVNNLTKDGIYYIVGSTPANAPSGITWCILTQITMSSIIHQYIMKPVYGGVWIREYSGGSPATWHPWRQLNSVAPYGYGQTNLSETLKNCTGTIAEHMKYHVANGILMLEGRLIINNFVRTAANPGFTFSIPNGEKIKRTFNIASTGISATQDKPVRFGEIVHVYGTAGSSTVTVDTTETIDNMTSSNKAVFIVYPIVIELE